MASSGISEWIYPVIGLKFRRKTLPTCNQNQKNICNHPTGGKKWDDKKGCGETQETVGQESEENRVFQERGHG